MEFKNRYYYDDNGKVIRKEFNNVINKDFKNFIEDQNDYPRKDIKIVDKKIVFKTDSDKEKDEQEAYNNLTWDRKRVTKYPHIENQIDAIYKGFQVIKNNITLPQETLDWLDQCKKVKEDIPKE
tara:strand:+ start:199 stop:570 length:372 start_codon:yes stop_codon:yes gene_type:complete